VPEIAEPDPSRPAWAGKPDATALRALMAVSRLLAVRPEDGAEEVYAGLVREARSCFDAPAVLLAEPVAGRRLRFLAGDVASGIAEGEVDLDAQRAIAELLDRRVRMHRADGERAVEIRGLLAGETPGPMLLLLLRDAGQAGDAVLVLAGAEPVAPSAVEADVAVAFADAGAAALGRLRAYEDHRRQIARQRALTRAAKTLNESLDLDTVLARICQEAATILDADIATVYRGSLGGDQTVAAAFGLPPEAVGFVMPPGAGLAGKVAVHGRAMLTNDYRRIAGPVEGSPFQGQERAMAAPVRWDGELRGVLSIGFGAGRRVDQDDLRLLETFAELAAVACANASAHAGLVQAARTDGLTGCLNHAALHEGLQKEIERAIRDEAEALSLVLLDLDHFKAVNEAHGHLAGDEVLRRAGHALRQSTRPYDLAARYGGDEFALVTVGAGEEEAGEIARRALERMAEAIGDLLPADLSVATAGVAQWSPGITAVELVARADRALLHAKQEGFRGEVLAFSEVPGHFRPGRFARTERGLPDPPPMPAEGEEHAWPGQKLDARLRKRTRQLAAANALGARLAAMTDVDAILDAAVDELHRALGFHLVAMIRLRPDDIVEAATLRGAPFLRLLEARWSQPRSQGLIGRCLHERRAVLSNDVAREPEYRETPQTGDVQSELVVPLWVGDELWGAINVEEPRTDAFDEEDLLLLQTVADQVGSAMRSAQLYEQLERAYLGTAEALAAALEAKDAYTAAHARSLVEQAEWLGRTLGLSEPDLRDLRFAAVFHDIGKIAIPERILNKRGPLSADERVLMERHTEVGEQILSPVEFLEGVRRLVRHEHERWDGNGYPDRLRGEEIPLGSRIILVCDALHAMTSDRPYRRAMPLDEALEELRRGAGMQFDPAVVAAMLSLMALGEKPVA